MNSLLFYATNRNLLSAIGEEVRFGSELGDKISYGYFDTSLVPHSMEAEAFYGQLQRILQEGGDVVNFLHGYYADFKTTLVKARKVSERYAVDTIGHQRAVVVFSWPSKSKLIAIDEDIQAANASGKQIAQVLHSQLNLRLANEKIHLISQSLGNIALQSTVENWQGRDLSLAEVIMTAPVLPGKAFANGQQLSFLPKLAKRTTVYYNRRDFGGYLQPWFKIKASMQYRGPDRDSLPTGKVVVVNATRVLYLDHQYYLGSNDVMADILATINGTDADSPMLSRRFIKNQKHFELFKKPS